ncbi:hypothetical protein WJR50_12585 [Catalinimonas sp. 4WD22]|uniref:hypothetical protein n=1 Tax=Catalinimonas locisalis TaxID=3133978 RepID=UPI003101951F
MIRIDSNRNVNHWKRLTYLFLTFTFFPLILSAQSVVISEESNANPAASAILDVQSTDQGVLVPRMTLAQRNNIPSPSNGLLIYQTNSTPGFYFYNGSAWEALKGGGEFTETDPQVGTIANNFVPRWNGSALVSSSIQQEDNITLFDNALITSQGSGRFSSYIRIYDETGSISEPDSDKGRFNIAQDGYAYIFLDGADNHPIVRLGSTYDVFDPDNRQYGVNRGGVYVFNGTSNDVPPRAGMEVNSLGQGRIFADVKSFVEDHPLDPSKEIVYACVEGPEAAMYMRGTTKLVNGKATINLPEHYRVLAVESSMTVLLTPLSASSNGLAVTTKDLKGIIVQELMNGSGSYEFDWEVKCVRKNFEDYQVVREKGNTNAASGSIYKSTTPGGDLQATPE